jgi:spermidine synthase
LIAQSLIRVFEAEIDPAAVAITNSIQFQIVIHVLVLFGACMVLHGELYRLRPAASSLTTFYLCLSAGGALGGIFVGAFAPRIFDDYRELEVGLALAWLLLLAACWQDTRGWLSPAAPHRRWALALALAATPLGWAASSTLRGSTETVYQERSFFGVLRVWSIGSGPGRQRQLWNGSTLHGVQFPNEPLRPTSYYGVQTGIGLALGQREPDSPVAIGVVGLGIGTLAAYGRPGDLIRFYEIDPAVVRIARDERWFTYLAQSPAEIEIVEGDARISLASEREQGGLPEFDFLIVDAFSSDAIPVHLLTREALALYLEALAPEGLLAFHVSNRYFDLVPVLARLAEDAGLRVIAINTETIPGQLSAPSTWVFLARDEERLRALARLAVERRNALGLSPRAMLVRRPSPHVLAHTTLWTDDHSDLLRVLRPLRGPRRNAARPRARRRGYDGRRVSR